MPQSLSIHPENVRKLLMFLTFLGGIESGQWHKMGSKEVYNTCLENKKRRQNFVRNNQNKFLSYFDSISSC